MAHSPVFPSYLTGHLQATDTCRPIAKRQHTKGRRRPSFVQGPEAFIWHYVRNWPLSFFPCFSWSPALPPAVLAFIYVMKMLVDAMAGPRGSSDSWWALSFFIGLIVIESVLWRLSGWLGCRTTVGVGVLIRLDLFRYLSGQPIRLLRGEPRGFAGTPHHVYRRTLWGPYQHSCLAHSPDLHRLHRRAHRILDSGLADDARACRCRLAHTWPD